MNKNKLFLLITVLVLFLIFVGVRVFNTFDPYLGFAIVGAAFYIFYRFNLKNLF